MATRSSDSTHFVPAGQISMVEESTAVEEVFDRLKEEGRGAFILTRGGRPAGFVRVDRLRTELAAEMEAAGSVDKTLGVMQRPVSEALDRLGATATVIQIIHEAVDVEAEEPGWQPEERICPVTKHGTVVGWHLSHETMRSAIETPPEVWYCDPNGHRNLRYNNGRCCCCSGSLR